MYVGHLAVAYILKAFNPTIDAKPIVFGAGFLDLLTGINGLLSINISTPNPTAGPYAYADLTFIDWDHSLLMAIVWSLAWGAFFLPKSRKGGLVATFASLSHWPLDWLVHDQSLALYPHSHIHYGLGLWSKLGTWSWILEGVFAAVLVSLATRKFATRQVTPIKSANWLLAILFFQLSPWTSPAYRLGQLDEPLRHILGGVMTFVGLFIPCSLLTWIFNKAEREGKARRASSGSSPQERRT